MDETAEVIAGLLSIAEGLEPPKALDDIDYLERILWAADKYEMPIAISAVRLALFSPFLAPAPSPIRLYGIACRMSWEKEAKHASSLTLTLDPLARHVMAELVGLEPAPREKLLALHRARRDAFALLPPLLARPPAGVPAALPRVFNAMLHPSQTRDGLHFSDAVVRAQAQVLLNARCNDVLPKAFPMDKACCRSYPWPSALHMVLLAAAVFWGPASWMIARRFSKPQPCSCVTFIEQAVDPRTSGLPLLRDEEVPALVVSFASAMIYIADRTGYWVKEQKQFDPWSFAFLTVLSLALGLATVNRGDKDLGFLNREQTDEWKGWMQS